MIHRDQLKKTQYRLRTFGLYFSEKTIETVLEAALDTGVVEPQHSARDARERAEMEMEKYRDYDMGFEDGFDDGQDALIAYLKELEEGPKEAA